MDRVVTTLFLYLLALSAVMVVVNIYDKDWRGLLLWGLYMSMVVSLYWIRRK